MKKKHPLTNARTLHVKPSTYRPSVEELNEEHDMPGMTMEQVRDAFFSPVKFVEKKD